MRSADKNTMAYLEHWGGCQWGQSPTSFAADTFGHGAVWTGSVHFSGVKSASKRHHSDVVTATCPGVGTLAMACSYGSVIRAELRCVVRTKNGDRERFESWETESEGLLTATTRRAFNILLPEWRKDAEERAARNKRFSELQHELCDARLNA